MKKETPRINKRQEILNKYATEFTIPDMREIPDEDKPFIRDFMLILKDEKKVTYEKMAAVANVSVATVGRFFSSRDKDNGCNVYSAGAIAKLLGFSLDDYFGIDHKHRSLEDAHKIEMLNIEVEHQKELRKITEKNNKLLVAFVAALIIAIIFALIDLFSPAIGTTAGSLTLLWLFVAVIVVYFALVLFFIGREKK